MMKTQQLDLFGSAPVSTHLESGTKAFGELQFSMGSEGFDTTTNWLIKDLIPASSFGMIYGSSGALKSFCTIGLSYSISIDKHWCNKPVQSGAVVYVAAEGQSGTAKRVKACEVISGIKTKNLYVLGQSVNMSDEHSVTTLINAVQAIEIQEKVKVKMIVLDTLARCYSGDENTSRDMSLFVQGCDSLKSTIDATVLCVHHSGRDENRGARGSSALKAACDFEFQVRRQGKEKKATLINTKQKDSDEAASIELEFEVVDLGIICDEGSSLTSLASTNAVSLTDSNESTFDCPILDLISDQFNGQAKRIEVRQALYPSGSKPTDAQRKSLSRSIKKLQSAGRITIEQVSPPRSSDEDIISLTH